MKNPAACVADGDDGCGCVKITAPDTLTGCESIGDGHWRTPYQKELMQAYIDGSWGNLTNAGYYFWSATSYSNATHTGWYFILSNGYTVNDIKTASYGVRCVR